MSNENIVSEYLKITNEYKEKYGIKTYKQLVKIAEEEYRKVGQQIANLVKKEYESRYGNEIKDMGIGSAKRL